MTTQETNQVSWIKGIGFKAAIAMSIGLFVVISIFSHLNVLLTEKKMLNTMQLEATMMNKAMLSSLESAMVSNDRQAIQSVVDTVSHELSVKDVRITDNTGRIMWAKDKSTIGTILDKTQDNSCRACHSSAPPTKTSLATITHDNNGIKILSSATLINNKPDCYNCHDANNKFIGKLLVDFSTNKMDMMVSDNRNMLILSTIATILSSIILSFIILAILIRKPLNRLLAGINDVKQGQRNVMDDIEGDDEISLLNRKFNSMVMAVYEYEQAIICNNLRERMTLASVCESLNLSDSGSVDEVSNHIIDAINIGFDVEKCAIVVINDCGDVRVQTVLGLSEDETDVLRNYMEVVLSDESAYSLHDDKIKRIKETARRGEIFLSAGTANIVDDFLVVPLKVAHTLRGAIIICAVKGEELNTPKLKELFAIVATSIAPHFHLSLSLDDNKRMAKSPFNVFIDTVRAGIHNVEEYQMALSLVMLKIENYKEVCLISGSEDANLSVQTLCESLSASIKKVHTMTRITENLIALLLPMTDKEDAEELIKTVLATAGNKNLKVAFKIGSYPEDGDKAEDLICACS